MEKEEKITIAVYTESFWQSVMADIVSFVMLVGMFYANIHYIQSRLFSAVIIVLFVLKLIAYASSHKTVYTSHEEAIKALKK